MLRPISEDEPKAADQGITKTKQVESDNDQLLLLSNIEDFVTKNVQMIKRNRNLKTRLKRLSSFASCNKSDGPEPQPCVLGGEGDHEGDGEADMLELEADILCQALKKRNLSLLTSKTLLGLAHQNKASQDEILGIIIRQDQNRQDEDKSPSAQGSSQPRSLKIDPISRHAPGSYIC